MLDLLYVGGRYRDQTTEYNRGKCGGVVNLYLLHLVGVVNLPSHEGGRSHPWSV